MLITDAQVHMWDVPSAEHPWPAGRLEPHRPNGFSAEQCLAEMDAAGVDRVVIVPPSWIGEYNGTGLAAAQKYPKRFGVMGRFDPTTPDAREQLAGWMQQSGMLGIRMSFHIEPHKTWLVDGTMNWFWAEAERLQIPLMVLVPATSTHIGPVAERHPNLTLIIDHLGTPREVAGDAAWVDLDSLLGLAKYPNVYAKASCMPIYSEQPYPHQDLWTPLQRVYDAFGPRRMMWGTDLTRLPGTYRQAVTLFTEALPFLTADDREWVMGRTIAEALRWPEG